MAEVRLWLGYGLRHGDRSTAQRSSSTRMAGEAGLWQGVAPVP
jgi:hypothetical protein